MSLDEEDDFWNSSDVKAFNFDDEDQNNQSVATNSTHNNNPSGKQNTVPSASIKTLGSILAARPSSNEPFLRPSMMMCDENRVEQLIEYLDSSGLNLRTPESRLDPKSYIRDIVDKKAAIDFSPYRSKREKLLLLDCAICCFDGNTITAVTIFISKTLKNSLFVETLKSRPQAVSHYIHYLEMTKRSREADELLRSLSCD